MPVEFLSDEQGAGFGRFAGELSQSDLDRFFYLDDADRDLVAVRRGDHNRLGFAVQLGTVRFLGAFLADPLDVPRGVVEYLAAQLEITEPLVVRKYTQRVPTAHEHVREIRATYGYRDLDGPLTEELTLFVYSRAWTHGEGLTVLFEHATAWLRRERVLLPGVSVLMRLVAEIRDQATADLHEAVGTATDAVDPRLPVVLGSLLTAEQGERTSRLESLRAGPMRLSGPELNKALMSGLHGRRKVRREEIDEALVPASWRVAVFGRTDDVEVDRDAWVVCVLELLRSHLRRRDVFATASTRWGDPRAQLLAGSAWDAAREPTLRSLSLDGPVSEHLTAKVALLDTAWRGLAAAIADAGPDASVRLTEASGDKVKLSVAPLGALEVPESLTALRVQVAGLLPRVDLPEILLEVHSWTGFLDAYAHVSGAASRMADLPLSVAAVLIAEACNVGLTPVVAEMHAALSRDRLGHVQANYVRTETHTAANALLIEAQAGVPIARSWGGGLLASVDGLRFVVPVRTINAAPNPKYFGHRRGLTWFNAVNDQVAGISAVVIPGTVRDSLYVLDTMLNLDGGPKPEMVASDTASYSDMIFGIFTLLGYRFSPRIADLADQRLWRATLPGQSPAEYGPLNDVARNRVNLQKIIAHWDDMTALPRRW